MSAPGLVDHSWIRSEEHTSELQSRPHPVCRLLLEKKKRDDVQLCAAIQHEKGAGAAASSPPCRDPPSRLYQPVARPLQLRGLQFFFFNDTATTEIYTLSLHDALPI